MTRSIYTAALVVAAVLMSASTAFAVLPPEAYAEARDSAQYHVRVQVTNVSVPSKTPGDCTVTGSVDSILRKADDDLAEGAELTLEVSCRHPGDEVPDGGTLWTKIGALKAAAVIEAYINKSGDGYRIARDQVSIVESNGSAGGDDGSSANVALYAGIGVGAVVAALVVFFLVRRKS